MTLEEYTNLRENTTQGYVSMRLMCFNQKSHYILNFVYALTTLSSSKHYENLQKTD